MQQTPYERGYQAGLCYLPDRKDVEEDAYYEALTKVAQQEYNRGWLDGHAIKEKARWQWIDRTGWRWV